MLKAIYEETNEKCYVNMNYVIDVFQHNFTQYKAYTFDNERHAYIIDKEDFENYLKSIEE